jgi:Flp pilus assembly pilin Flp
MSDTTTVSRAIEPARSGVRGRLARFLADERGDEGVNKVLIIAMIVVPLVIVLIIFGKDIVTFFKAAWTKVKGKSESEGPETGY